MHSSPFISTVSVPLFWDVNVQKNNSFKNLNRKCKNPVGMEVHTLEEEINQKYIIKILLIQYYLVLMTNGRI